MSLRDFDDEVTGPPIMVVARTPDTAIGRPSIPCPRDGVLLVGDTCPKCRRTYAVSSARVENGGDDDAQALMSEMPGGAPRKPTWGST